MVHEVSPSALKARRGCKWFLFATIGLAVAMLALVALIPADPVSYRQLAGMDNFAATFPANTSHAAVEASVRKKCAERQFCKVMGWHDASLAATAMPMTDRELEGEKLDYSLNRHSGLDEFTWLDGSRRSGR